MRFEEEASACTIASRTSWKYINIMLGMLDGVLSSEEKRRNVL
jgi:hypothetical protein